MIGWLGNLVFLNGWALGALAGLPLLWYLLRIIPPGPKHIILPSAAFLTGLQSTETTTSKTPWWVLLLRLMIITLIILAVARPVYNPAAQIPGGGTMRILIDNSWPSGVSWQAQQEEAGKIISQARRDRRNVMILTTAPRPGITDVFSTGPLTPSEADSIISGLKPLPWPADYISVLNSLNSNKPDGSVYTIWLSHGLQETGTDSIFISILEILQRQGGMTWAGPNAKDLPAILKDVRRERENLVAELLTPVEFAETSPIQVQALNQNGDLIDLQNSASKNGKITVHFNLPQDLDNTVSELRIAGKSSAGGVYHLGESFTRRSVGLMTDGQNGQTKPFIEAQFYLERALEPFTTLHKGNIPALMAEDPSMIILPDLASLPVDHLNKLESWVRDGGLLLRFAGPEMADMRQEPFLTPVRLRQGGRALEGSLSWEKPAKMATISENSPLFGISSGEEFTVKRQVLADPSEDLDHKIWATLEDGTPFITAAPLGSGQLVLIHTTASPDWSDLALSGTYVEILRRLVRISGKPHMGEQVAMGAFEPVWVYDGFGRKTPPESYIRQIPASSISDFIPNAFNPPGLYTQAGFMRAFNLGDHINHLKIPEKFPSGVSKQSYGGSKERDLTPPVLFAAFLLFLFDWTLYLFLFSGIRFRRKAPVTCIIAILFSFPAFAQSPGYEKYALGIHLAYVQTGDPVIDATSLKGLQNLAEVLKSRTSVEPVGVVSVNLQKDAENLSFFPLLYWPVSSAQGLPDTRTVQNIQKYLDHGGTILFDTRDGGQKAGGQASTNAQHLSQMISGLNIPPLSPISEDHVLSRAFYLLDRFQGLHEDGTIWVEKQSSGGRDGVSSVLIGGQDWASAWASDLYGISGLRGGTRQQEMAFRFGVNLMIYALTGNYKADQVHVPHILERLGQ